MSYYVYIYIISNHIIPETVKRWANQIFDALQKVSFQL